SRGRTALLATAVAGRQGDAPLPVPLRRQGESGAPLLGLLRPRVTPVLRPPCPSTSGWRPECRGLGDGGGVLAGAEQLWVLARWRRGGGVLWLRIPGARRV